MIKTTPTQKTRCTSCQKNCVGVCQEIHAKHKNVILEISAFHRAKIYGTPCNDIETWGIENLYVEKEISVGQPLGKKSAKAFSAIQLHTEPQEDQNIPSYEIHDIDKLLQELESPLKNKPATTSLPAQPNPICLAESSEELTKLIRVGASQVLAFLQPGSSQALCNNLDDTNQKLEKKNNEFPMILKAATDSEKSNPIFQRLCRLVPQAISSTKRNAEKEPILSFINDITHPCNSYLNEIELLQNTLQK